MEQLTYFVGLIGLIAGAIYRHWTKFSDVYKCSKSAFWIVEEIAEQEGLITEEKIKLFEDKFKILMHWAGRIVTKNTMKLAHDLARKFCAKYRKH